MKRMMTAFVLMLMLPVLALAEGPVLMVELPENAQMVENVEFDDGDFIQTYQLDEGVVVQILRYASFAMTLEDLAQGEWTGYTAAQTMDVAEIGGCPAQGMHLTVQQQGDAGAQGVEVYMLLIDAQGQTLIFEAVFPSALGEARIQGDMDAWMNTMDVYDANEIEVG